MNRRSLQIVADAALAAVLAAIAVLEVWIPLSSAQGDGSPVLSTVVAVLLCLALSFRRRLPLATALVVLLTWPVIFTIQPILVLFWGQLLPIAVASYSVARYGTRRASLIGAAAAAACLLFFDLRVEPLQNPGEMVFHWSLLALAWGLGTLVRIAEARTADARRRAIEVEAASRTRTLAALAAERARIARELHDVVAHAVSVMVVQAGAAEQVVKDDPAYAQWALGTIRATGADALAEMRRVVSMLRDDEASVHEGGGAVTGTAANPLRPQPGATTLAELVGDTVAAGLPVSLHVHGTPRPLVPGLDLALYRIVQEALTNVRRHADATRAEVRLHYRDSAVTIEVRDDGKGPDSGAPASGNGLIGMRERAAIYGGSVDTSRHSEGGFVVRAELPIGRTP